MRISTKIIGMEVGRLQINFLIDRKGNLLWLKNHAGTKKIEFLFSGPIVSDTEPTSSCEH